MRESPFSRSVLLLVLVAAVALMAAGCQGPGAAATSEQGTGLSARAEDEVALANPEKATAEATSSPVPTATALPSRTPTPVPTSMPVPTSTPSLATQPARTPAPELPTAPVTGALAPDLTLPDLSGNEVTLSSLRGSAVLLNFWTTW